MKNVFYITLSFIALSVISACSNGAYTANPSSNANASINPLKPLDSAQFNWVNSGTSPMSASINGAGWVADNATYAFDSGQNVIFGYKGSTQILALYLGGVYQVNIYSMGYQQYNTWGYYTDSIGNVQRYFQSVLGNSGEVQILVNNPTAIEGMFYFQGVNLRGAVTNVTYGYFNVSKI